MGSPRRMPRRTGAAALRPATVRTYAGTPVTVSTLDDLQGLHPQAILVQPEDPELRAELRRRVPLHPVKTYLQRLNPPEPEERPGQLGLFR